jgi:signal transduction histidine kinase
MQAYAGVQPLTPARLETLPFLCDLAHLLRRVLDERVTVSVVVGHDCPSCYADGNALEEALMHLVVNACEAMPEGGRLLLCARADTVPDGRPAVAMSVSDNGVGMSPDFARRAVQPFVTTKSNRAEAGMGLAAADGFARQSGGHLTLFSQIGTGVTATLSLPQFTPDCSPTLDT